MSRIPALVTTLRHAGLFLVYGLTLGTGCNAHSIGGFDDGPQIDEHGISVPVPPPSLWAAPIQRVVIEGQLGISAPEPMTEVFVLDARREDGGFNGVYAASDGSFRFDGPNAVEIDVTNNCLEVWSEGPGVNGEMSLHSFFRVTIAEDDQSLLTEQFFSGC